MRPMGVICQNIIKRKEFTKHGGAGFVVSPFSCEDKNVLLNIITGGAKIILQV